MIYNVENISENKFTDALYEKAYSTMSPARKEKADRYKHIQDKKLCVFSDMLLREMLSKHFRIETPDFYLSESGKPCLLGDNVHFSISHSGSYIACAVDTSSVGIDIETPRDINKRILDHCCTRDEIGYICADVSALPDPIPAESPEAQRFLTLWTAKEAYLKYTGQGLSGGLDSVVTIENGKLRSLINQKKLTIVTKKDYVISVISENT